MAEDMGFLGKKVPRAEYEEDEKLTYLTLEEMFAIVSLISEVVSWNPEYAKAIRQQFFYDPKMRDKMKSIRSKLYQEIQRELEGREEYQ